MRENPHTVQLFTEVAPKYEFLNSLMTLGRDRHWRTTALSQAEKALGYRPEVALDLATGTGDVARLLSARWPKTRIIGSDPTLAMLEIAQQKSLSKIEWLQGTAENIALEKNSVDLITMAFGFRNVDRDLRPQALGEMLRVLKPGGVIAILELGLPASPWAKAIYKPLLRYGMPTIAGLFAPRDPYIYLAQSIEEFPPPQEVKKMFHQTSLLAFEPIALTFGMSWLYLGKKQQT